MQYATAPRPASILVNINPAYRTHELAYALRQSGCRRARRRQRSRRATTGRWSTRCGPTLPGLERVVFLGTDDWDDAARRRRRRSTVDARRAGGDAGVRRPDQHPVHERHHGLPEGRDADPPQHPQQRVLRRRGLPLHRGRPRVHPRALLPLLRHGARQPRLHDPRRRAWSSRRRRSSPAADARRGRRPSAARASTACRRCSSPSSTIPTSTRYDLSSLRTGIMAGSPCPVEVMKRCVDRHAHGRGHHLLRHDRDVAGLDPDRADDPIDKRVGTVGRVHPHVEVKVVDPDTGRTRRRAASPASSAPAATR